MLLELRIKNFALIEDLQVSLGDTFNVLTGETGAGKTILLQALGLLCGAKFLAGSARDENCDVIVEAMFTPKSTSRLIAVLNDLGLEYETGEWILRRSILPGGRNKCSLNGNLLRVQDLKELAPFLVDIHSQHQTGELLEPKNHLKFIESYCSELIRENLVSYRSKVKNFRDLCRRHENSEQYAQKLTREIAQLEMELAEIEEVQPKVGEEKTLTELHLRLVNRGEIQSLLHDCKNILDPSSEQSAIYELLVMEGKIESIIGFDEQFQSRLEDIQAVNLQLEELRQQLAIYESDLENVNPHEIFEVEERLANLEKLKRKYGATVEEVLQYESEAADKLFTLQSELKQLESLDEEIEKLTCDLVKIADDLQNELSNLAFQLSAKVEEQLHRLKMKDSIFEVRFEEPAAGNSIKLKYCDEYKFLGLRSPKECQFYLSANKGSDPLPLAKIASGGEISRTMLALKRVFSLVHPSQTFVFDEIDSGIGGETAHTVAEILAEIAAKPDQNILVITHLPQVAIKAAKHFRVEKQTQNETTSTTVELLQESEVRDEIARMMGLNGSSSELREIVGTAK